MSDKPMCPHNWVPGTVLGEYCDICDEERGYPDPDTARWRSLADDLAEALKEIDSDPAAYIMGDAVWGRVQAALLRYSQARGKGK